jgi:hypothetical protein
MTKDELIAGLRRLTAGSPSATERMDRGEQEAYVAEVMTFHGSRLTGLGWKGVVDWMLQNRRAKGLPTIQEIGAAIESARKAGMAASSGGNGCSACGGMGQVGGLYARRRVDGEVGEFFRACPKCSHAGSGDAGPPFGWEALNVEVDRQMLQAMSLSPASARRVLDQLGKSERREKGFREDVYLMLVQRAGLPDQLKAPPLRQLRDVIAEVMPSRPTAREVDA